MSFQRSHHRERHQFRSHHLEAADAHAEPCQRFDYTHDNALEELNALFGPTHKRARSQNNGNAYIIEEERGIILAKISMQNSWRFWSPKILYAVVHVGLPFPIVFRSWTDASTFFSSELERLAIESGTSVGET
jgi:hypothetical protein